MKDYVLGDKIISVTEDKYNSIFKALGYVPVVTTKKTSKKEEVKQEEFKEPVIEETSYKKYKKEN